MFFKPLATIALACSSSLAAPPSWRHTNMFTPTNYTTAYKLFYVARHAEGYHNAAETLYGTPAWNCYWSKQNSDVAQSVNAGWKTNSRRPLPQSLYSSPLSRAASTLNITWEDILIDPKKIRPVFLENLRESIGLHTCDQRSNKGYLEATYPDFKFETPFSFHDELWGPTYQEQNSQQALRTQQLLHKIFATDPNTFISLTAHGGSISGFFTAISHKSFGVQTGRLDPVVVKAVAYHHYNNKIIVGGQSGTAPVCTANPTTAVVASATATNSATVYPATMPLAV